MVTHTNSVWKCDVCGFHYKEKEWAGKCETWCTDNHSCNLEIIAHAEENQNTNPHE